MHVVERATYTCTHEHTHTYSLAHTRTRMHKRTYMALRRVSLLRNVGSSEMPLLTRLLQAIAGSEESSIAQECLW